MLIVNSDNLAPTEFASAYQSAGVDTLSYSPPSASLPASGWPTLGTLIDAGTRLVTFLSTTADFTSVPYLIDGMLRSSVPRPIAINIIADNCSSISVQSSQMSGKPRSM